MKPFIPYSLLAAAALCGVAFGQTATTTPVGYVTHTLAPNMYTLVSVTLHEPVIASGVLSGATATSVSTTGVNFSTLLEAGSVYLLELPNGTIQEISSWTDVSLNTPENISGSVQAGTTQYKLRKASTVSSVFGANNSVGLVYDGDEDLTNNDVLLVPNAANAFDTIYYFDNGEISGWYDDLGNEADNRVLNYADAFFVQRRAGASNLSLVVSGEVKLTPTSSVLVSGYNFLGSVAPVGLTLANSGLQNYLTVATSEEDVATTADLVLLQQPDGAYRTAYYYNDGETTGWFDDLGNEADSIPLEGGFLIQNKGAGKAFTVAVPSSYSSL